QLTDDRARRRFARECEATERIGAHPRIVSSLRHGETATGQPYIEMEYYKRGSLEGMLEQGILSVPSVLQVGIQIADALSAAHHSGVLHRDVKPGNVLVADDGSCAIADFGIAGVQKGVGASLTIDALTPLHAPPEVLRDGRPGSTADLYSLGSTMYTLLTGRP